MAVTDSDACREKKRGLGYRQVPQGTYSMSAPHPARTRATSRLRFLVFERAHPHKLIIYVQLTRYIHTLNGRPVILCMVWCPAMGSSEYLYVVEGMLGICLVLTCRLT